MINDIAREIADTLCRRHETFIRALHEVEKIREPGHRIPAKKSVEKYALSAAETFVQFMSAQHAEVQGCVAAMIAEVSHDQ